MTSYTVAGGVQCDAGKKSRTKMDATYALQSTHCQNRMLQTRNSIGAQQTLQVFTFFVCGENIIKRKRICIVATT